jgi:hypothetical protein
MGELFPQNLAKLVEFSLENQKLPNCFVKNKDIIFIGNKSTGQDGYMWGCQCFFGEVFLNLKNLILTHIRVFVKKYPNSPDFYNRFQQVAKI